MQRQLTIMSQLLAAMMLLATVSAQQTPAAAQPSQTPSGSATGSAAAKTPAGKKTATARSASGVTLKTQKEKASYALGMSIGAGLHKQDLGVDAALVSRGLKDAMSGNKTLLTEDEMKTALQQLQADVQRARETKARAVEETNRKQGEAFLATNKTKEGVKTLPDGLQYKILKEGSGPKPAATDTVSVNYRGTLVNGKEFDSSYKRGQPASFAVNGVIKGWTEALQMMPVGSKWQLFIPADLAYGDRPPVPSIGPGDTLVFEVELLSIAGQNK